MAVCYSNRITEEIVYGIMRKRKPQMRTSMLGLEKKNQPIIKGGNWTDSTPF
jgi:hypothetical protein